VQAAGPILTLGRRSCGLVGHGMSTPKPALIGDPDAENRLRAYSAIGDDFGRRGIDTPALRRGHRP